MTLVNSLSWPVSCCDGPLELEESTAEENGREARMELRCPRCEGQWAATVFWRKRRHRKVVNTTPVDVERIGTAVAAYYDTTWEALVGYGSRRETRVARQSAMYLCHELTDASYPLLGRVFQRNHTTVITACERMGERRQDPAIEEDVNECRRYVEERTEERAA